MEREGCRVLCLLSNFAPACLLLTSSTPMSGISRSIMADRSEKGMRGGPAWRHRQGLAGQTDRLIAIIHFIFWIHLQCHCGVAVVSRCWHGAWRRDG